MSGFLSNLIARSFTDAPVIQPRLPSLFESAAEKFPGEQQSFTPAIATPETIAPTNVPPPTPVSKSWDARAEESLSEADAHMFNARAEESVPQPAASPAQNAPLVPRVPHSSVQAGDIRKLEVETKRIVLPVNFFQDRQDLPNNRGAASENLSDKKSMPEEFSPSLSIRPLARRQLSPAAPLSSTSRPIIRVTIGRVEVRAIHPPAPAPKPAKPVPPKLSLEDYLRKRERGSR